ncbi:hypothetical protein [Micromonospora sp. LOL_015]
MRLDLPDGPPVGIDAEDLAAAVDAVLGNAFAHTRTAPHSPSR